jgi:anti-anti-sigma factor
VSATDAAAWTRVHTRAAQRTVLVCVGGEIDHLTAPDVTLALCAAIDTATSDDGDGWRVVVDLHQVTFCGTAGLHTLIQTQQHATRRGLSGLVLLAPAEHPVTRLLRLTGMDAVITTTTPPQPAPDTVDDGTDPH